MKSNYRANLSTTVLPVFDPLTISVDTARKKIFMHFNNTYDNKEEYLSGLSSPELVDELNIKTMHYLTLLREKNKEQAKILKSDVENIQAVIFNRKKTGGWGMPLLRIHDLF